MSSNLEKSELSEIIAKGVKFALRIREEIVNLSKLYVDSIDKYPNAREEWRRALPEFTRPTWNKIESIGRGLMQPKLFWKSGYYTWYVSRLPIDEQKRVIEEGVEVLTTDKTSLKVQLDDLQIDQIRQVFDRNGLRSLSAQKAWIENEKQLQEYHKRLAQNPKSKTHRVDIQKKVLIVFVGKGAVEFTFRNLKKILRDAGEL